MRHVYLPCTPKGAKLHGPDLTVRFRVEDAAFPECWPARSKLACPTVPGQDVRLQHDDPDLVEVWRVELEPAELPRRDDGRVEKSAARALIQSIGDPTQDGRCILTPLGRAHLVMEAGKCEDAGIGWYEMAMEWRLDLSDREHLAAPGTALDLVLTQASIVQLLVETVQLDIEDAEVVSLGAERAKRQAELALDDHRAERQVEDLLREKTARLLKRMEGDGFSVRMRVTGPGGGVLNDVLRDVAEQVNAASVLTPEQIANLREAEAHDNAIDADDGYVEFPVEIKPDDPLIGRIRLVDESPSDEPERPVPGGHESVPKTAGWPPVSFADGDVVTCNDGNHTGEWTVWHSKIANEHAEYVLHSNEGDRRLIAAESELVLVRRRNPVSVDDDCARDEPEDPRPGSYDPAPKTEPPKAPGRPYRSRKESAHADQ